MIHYKLNSKSDIIIKHPLFGFCIFAVVFNFDDEDDEDDDDDDDVSKSDTDGKDAEAPGDPRFLGALCANPVCLSFNIIFHTFSI